MNFKLKLFCKNYILFVYLKNSGKMPQNDGVCQISQTNLPPKFWPWTFPEEVFFETYKIVFSTPWNISYNFFTSDVIFEYPIFDKCNKKVQNSFSELLMCHHTW